MAGWGGAVTARRVASRAKRRRHKKGRRPLDGWRPSSAVAAATTGGRKRGDGSAGGPSVASSVSTAERECCDGLEGDRTGAAVG